MTHLAAALLLLAVPQAPAAAPPASHTFVDLDPGSATASLEDIEPVVRGSEGCVLTVEVARPRGFDGHVEPLRFRVTPKGRDAQPIELLRVDAPFHGRAGRAAGDEPVEVQLLCPLDPKAARGARIEVLDVSAWTGPAPRSEPPVEVGRPRTTTAVDPDYQRSLTRSTIAVTNTCAFDVDYVLAVEFVGPKKATSLVRGRVAANATDQLVVRHLPTGLGEFPGAEARSAELVDWSVLVDDGAEEARRLLTRVWDGAYRVPAERLPLAARVTWEATASGGRTRREGRFVVEADGGITVELDGEHDATSTRTVTTDLERALWAIARAPGASVGGGVTLVRGGAAPIVRSDAPLFEHGLQGAVSVAIEGGRIARTASDALAGLMGDALPRVWSWSAGGAPRLLGWSQRSISSIPAARTDVRLDWLRHGDLWLPVRFSEVTPEWSPGMGRATTLTLGDWTPDVAPIEDAALPTGALADGLRAAWDGFYRYPTWDARITGEFRARTPATDGVWIGRRDVRGSVRLAGITGSYFRESSAEVDEKRATDDERATLEGAVLDRVLMWTGRDLCRQPRFDEAFRGARLERDGPWTLTHGAALEAVRVEDGRVAAIRTRFGAEVEFLWKEVRGALLPIERTSGEETLTIDWREVEDGWLLPARVRFEDVFGEDWGPETLELSKVEVEVMEDGD